MEETTSVLDTLEVDFSRILFARPSSVEGAARIFDMAGTLSEYSRAETGDEADFYALLSDWCAVGQDIKQAMRDLDKDQKRPTR